MTFLIALAVLAVLVAVMYNGLVQLRERVDASWSDIDVQLTRRHDLIPNLVETVRGYASHESGTLEKVIQARNSALSASGPDQKAQAEAGLVGALRSIFALAEAYPDLKANQNFLRLQDSLSEIEEQVQSARRYYNAVVRDYNTKIRQVPTNLVATGFGFSVREFFAAGEEERSVPRVSFGPDTTAR